MFLGVVLALISVLFICALATYHTSDASWNTSTDSTGPGMVVNWVGPFGAFISDLLLQWIGFTAFLVPLWMGSLAWAWVRSRPGTSVVLRAVGAVMALMFVPALFALLPWHWHWAHAIPVEGVMGRLIAGMLVAYLNIQGAWIVASVLALAGVYFASAISFWALKEMAADRLIQWQALRDRWRNWREDRADRRAERDEILDEQNNPGPAQRIFTGAIGTEAAAEPVMQRPPSRLAALFGRRHRVPEPDPVDQPAFQRSAAQATGDQIPIGQTRRASIWESGPEIPVAARAEQTTNPAVVPVRQQPPVTQPRPVTTMPAAAAPMRSAAAQAFAEMRGGPAGSQVSESRPGAPGSLGPSPNRMEPAPEMRPEPAATMRTDPPAPQQPTGNGIAIHERADADVRTTTVPPKHVSGFKLPPSTLLNAGGGPQAIREDELREEAKVLVEKCGEFDVRGQVVQINPGPMVTTYEFKPEAGVKYSRVTGLADDLCLAMRAESILIERMAGKSTVGIQVPNHERETIHLRDVL
ncbi:MAG TPA: DNA translocase FtsK 4TM domain-containing protein, partial [Acetobacteraceae bacterium]